MSKIKHFLYLIITNILLLFTFCSKDSGLNTVKKTDFAMGTIIQITVLDSTEKSAQKAIDLALQEIKRVGNLFYKGNPSSPIYKFNNRSKDTIKMPIEVLDLIWRGTQIAKKTMGSFDMTIEKILPYYSFNGDSLQPPQKLLIDSLKKYVNYKNLKIDLEQGALIANSRESRIATGGNAKGYAVDRAIHILDSLHVAGALVNAGGDLRVLPRKDNRKWTVGIQHPRNRNQTIGIIALKKGAVTTSGDYEQYYIYKNIRYHHIINPRTGFPARNSQSTTVIAPTAELADGLATALFILGYEKGLKILREFPNCHAFWVDSNGAYHSSPGFDKYLSKNYNSQ